MMKMANKEVLGLDVFRSFGTRYVTIFGKGKRTHVVLIDNVGFDVVSFKELACPKHVTNFIVETDNFALSRAF